MKNVLLAVIGLFVFASANAADSKFPAKFADFEKMSFAEMKTLPDVKWNLEKKATPADVEGKTETELMLMRNSIYAQYGTQFSQKALANYFLSRPWYKIDKKSPNLGMEKVSKLSSENVNFFLKTEASRHLGRAVADEGDTNTYYYNEKFIMQNAVANLLFQMGFCTYTVGKDAKAGMVVFDAGGKASVFHSQASRSVFAPYAYDGYMNESLPNEGSILIPAKWSIRNPKGDSKIYVTLDYDKATTDRYHEYLTPGTRTLLVIETKSTPNGPELKPNAAMARRECTMISK